MWPYYEKIIAENVTMEDAKKIIAKQPTPMRASRPEMQEKFTIERNNTSDEIIIPSNLDDEEYRDFLDENFEKCPQCGEYLKDEEVNTHDCGIEPKLENSFNSEK